MVFPRKAFKYVDTQLTTTDFRLSFLSLFLLANMSIGTAIRAFFAALGDKQTSDAFLKILNRGQAEFEVKPIAPKTECPSGGPGDAPRKEGPARSDALTLLATLQREARFVDLVQEPLDQFSDAQVGAAARPCLIQCRQTLQRIFDLIPLSEQAEGSPVTVPLNASPLRYQWLGNVKQSSSGILVHPGWLANRNELGKWTGSSQDANVISPIQVQA